MVLPVVVLVLLLDKELQVVQETVDDLALLALVDYEGWEFCGHVLTGLVAEAFLEGCLVADALANEHFFQFFRTIVV